MSLRAKIARWVVALVLGLFYRLIGRQRFLQAIFEAFRSLEERLGLYVSYMARPIKLASLPVPTSVPGAREQETALVLQGPLLREADFTYETLRLYRAFYPQAHLILSTWDTEDPATLARIQELGVEVVLSPDAEYPGISNINRQIKSAMAGLDRARELGCAYTLKTRTDQRFYNPTTLAFLHNLLKQFPLGEPSWGQKQRMIGMDLNTFRYRLYGLSDMFLFGDAEDMHRYWSPAYDQRRKEEVLAGEATFSLRQFAQCRVCEVYLLTQYLAQIGRPLQWTLADSLSVYRDLFLIIDKAQIDLFWPKYTRRENRWTSYGERSRMQELGFTDWLNLQQTLVVTPEEEVFLDQG
ncbi:MAG: WavE lipopolysaccharide synthesis family protein [Desulfarculaceae bacterium]|nr:WavE lipopolysaccharide synthesis family protein [Desulfarculaceae bacterium]